MKRRIIAALCLRSSRRSQWRTSGVSATKASSITVWLQVDAQSGWPTAVAAANKAFEAQNPGVTVNVQYQQWNTHLQKFDATLAGGNTPDVIEMGNTEMTKYMAAGAFADITADKSKLPNSSTWLKGLADSATYGGKLMGVPYYAGTRVVIYRTDLFKQAGIKGTPTSLGQFAADGKKLMAATSRTPPSRRSTSPVRTGTRRSPSSTTSAARSPRSARTASGPARSTRRVPLPA